MTKIFSSLLMLTSSVLCAELCRITESAPVNSNNQYGYRPATIHFIEKEHCLIGPFERPATDDEKKVFNSPKAISLEDRLNTAKQDLEKALTKNNEEMYYPLTRPKAEKEYWENKIMLNKKEVEQKQQAYNDAQKAYDNEQATLNNPPTT